MTPIDATRLALFDPAFVRLHDQPGTVAVVESEPSGAAQVDFAVAAPSISLRGKAGNSLY